MLIDWFTVGAQVVNFLVLVWLLKRFLYEPVMQAIDAREKHIASQLASAAQERLRAGEERESYASKSRELVAERDRLLNEARSAAARERAELLQKARAEHEQLQARFETELSEERDELSRSIVARVLAETFAIARKLLGDLSDANLGGRIVDMFIRRIQSLSDEDRVGLRRLAAGSDEVAAPRALTVRSAFELSATQRADIERELRRELGDDGRIRYEQSPELVGGIELVANGYRLRWNIEDYLDSLREQIDSALSPTPRA
jgi:F-type H+-transporting ATPase subunit b